MSDGFSFSLRSGSTQLAEGACSVSDGSRLAAAMEQRLAQDGLTAHECSQITHHTLWATMVPRYLFRPDDGLHWLSPIMAGAPAASFACRANLIGQFGCYCVYAVRQDVSDYLEAQWPRTPQRHALTELIQTARHGAGPHLAARWNGTSLELCASADHRLLLANMAEATTQEDAAYHIMNAYRQLGFNPQQTPLQLHDMRTVRAGQSPLTLRDMLGRYVLFG